MQTAFHRPPASSSGGDTPAPVISDWDAVKGDDKTLVYQVRLLPILTLTYLLVSTCKAWFAFLLSCEPKLYRRSVHKASYIEAVLSTLLQQVL